MSEELGQSSLFSENPNTVLSNSKNSDGSEDRKGKKPFLPSSTSPTPTPTPTPSTPLSWKQGQNPCNDGGSSGGGDDGVESDHDDHVSTERERRKKMRNLFSTLHDLLPHLPPKTDKSTIIEVAAGYIKTLEHTLENLQKQKLDRMRGVTAAMDYQVPSMNSAITTNTSHTSAPTLPPASFKTWCSPNFVLNVCGEDAQINVCVPKKPGLLTTILCVLEKHKVEVISVQTSSDSCRSMFMIQAHERNHSYIEALRKPCRGNLLASMVFDQFRGTLSSEEIFNLAVTEMMFWIS